MYVLDKKKRRKNITTIHLKIVIFIAIKIADYGMGI